MTIIGKPPPGNPLSPEVRAIQKEGDELAKRMAAMHALKAQGVLEQVPVLGAHLFTLQMDAMQTYLHILTIRLARANDAANGIVPDSATALAGRKGIIKPN